VARLAAKGQSAATRGTRPVASSSDCTCMANCVCGDMLVE